MSNRKVFEMSEAQHAKLLDACKPVPYMVMAGVEPRSPYENACDAWRALGREMGFDWESVLPVPAKGERWFSAVPTDNTPL